MKTLLAGTSYIRDDYAEWIASQWIRLAYDVNPTSDILVVDTPSPYNPSIPRDGNRIPPIDNRFCLIKFSDNIGHLTYPAPLNGDGWGRATCTALDYAVLHSYDYVACIDCDVIYVDPIMPIFEMMERDGIKVISTREPHYRWLEGIEFFDVQWLRDTRFTQRYNWPIRNRADVPQEHLMEKLMGNDLRVIDLPGMRDDANQLTPDNMWLGFPYGITWLTHCKNKDVYIKLMQHYGKYV